MNEPLGKILFEGIASISALINASETGRARRGILRIYIERNRFESEFRRVKFVSAAAEKLGFEITPVTTDEASELAGGRTHGGFLAEVTPAVYPGLDLITPETGGYFALLEGAEDPYTLAHSLRSLYLCGAGGVILSRPLPDGQDALIARASAGTSELLPVFVGPADEAVGIFKKHGYTVAAASARSAEDCDRAAVPFPLLLVVGGEKRGITRKILDLCDISLRVPYAREALCSLPTESAVAVLAYEICRRTRAAKGDR